MKPKMGGAKRRPLSGAAEGSALLFFNLFAAFGYFCWPQPVGVYYFGPRKYCHLLLSDYITLLLFHVW